MVSLNSIFETRDKFKKIGFLEASNATILHDMIYVINTKKRLQISYIGTYKEEVYLLETDGFGNEISRKVLRNYLSHGSIGIHSAQSLIKSNT